MRGFKGRVEQVLADPALVAAFRFGFNAFWMALAYKLLQERRNNSRVAI
jgi:hypothetical protein